MDCCPEGIGSLNKVVIQDKIPVYLFHCQSDKKVPFDAGRLQAYETLSKKSNFRYVKVHADWTPELTNHNSELTYHNCWTPVFGHVDLYKWFMNLMGNLRYGSNKAQWPDFEDLSVPDPAKEIKRRKGKDLNRPTSQKARPRQSEVTKKKTVAPPPGK